MDGEAVYYGLNVTFPITSSWQTGRSSKIPTACSSAYGPQILCRKAELVNAFFATRDRIIGG